MNCNNITKPCLIIVLTILVLTGLTGCEEKAKPFQGETYQSMGGIKVVRIYSPDELEVKEGSSPNVVAKYTTEDGGNKLRVVITAMGITQAVYYTITKKGIVDEDGTTMYSSANLVKAREEHYCSDLKSDLEKLADAQNTYKRKKGQFIVSNEDGFPWGFGFKPGAGVSVDLSGAGKDPGAYFIALVTHKWCSNAYIWASASGGLQKPLSAKDAAGKIGEISVKADQEMKVARKIAEDERRKAEEKARIIANREMEIARKKAEDEKRKKEEKARMARIAREKAEKIARNQIIVVLESGKSYFGQENEKSFFGQDRELPFRILFESFDKQSGAVSGIMDYYPENDRSIIKFSGMLKGSTLTYQLKKIDRKGKSGIQTGKYTYRVGQNRLEGTYNEGEKVWINISEKDRKAKEIEVSALERLLKLIKESRTSTKVIATTATPQSGKVILTSVSLKWEKGSYSELFFSDITHISVEDYASSGSCVITLNGKNRRGLSYQWTKDYKQECNKFYNQASKAFNAWRKKYAKILKKK